MAMVNPHLHEVGDFKQKPGKLSAALKDTVKGREHEALIGTRDLPAQTGLAWQFIVNTLKSQMLEKILDIKAAEISDERVVITVPIDYGNRPL